MSDSLRPHGLYGPWNSPGQNTEVDSLSLLRGIFPNQGLNPGLPHCGQILLADLPNTGNIPGSPALQADSLPTELLGKTIELRCNPNDRVPEGGL